MAALTIPTLIANYQKAQYVNQLKVFISDFNNTLGVIKVEMGCSDLACTGIWDNAGADDSARSALMWPKMLATQKLRIAKDCGTAANTGCFSVSQKYLNGSDTTTHNPEVATYAGKAILANGVSFSMWDDAGNCLYNSIWGFEMCGPFTIDVNGVKPPNQWGRDIFHLRVSNQGVMYPFGVEKFSAAGFHWNNNDDGYACDPAAFPTGNGMTCAGRILDEGWQMNY